MLHNHRIFISQDGDTILQREIETEDAFLPNTIVYTDYTLSSLTPTQRVFRYVRDSDVMKDIHTAIYVDTNFLEIHA